MSETNEARRVIIARLRDDVASVEQRVHQAVPTDPVWPYLRYGVAVWTPRPSTCNERGMVGSLVIHVFTAGVSDDQCDTISGDVVLSLDNAVIAIPSGKLYLVWTGTQVLSDIGKSDGWHGIVNFDAQVVVD